MLSDFQITSKRGLDQHFARALLIESLLKKPVNDGCGISNHGFGNANESGGRPKWRQALEWIQGKSLLVQHCVHGHRRRCEFDAFKQIVFFDSLVGR